MPSNNGYEQLKSDEGFTPKATYLKTQEGPREKVRTIGHGYNIDAANDPRKDLVQSGVLPQDLDDVLAGKKAITEDQAATLFDIAIARASRDAARVIPNFDTLDKPIQDVIINMAYQLGGDGLKEFKQMRLALMEDDYPRVAKEILNSKAARRDSTNRYKRLAKSVLAYDEQREKPPEPQRKSARQLYNDAERSVLAKELAQLGQGSAKEALAKELAGLTTVTNSYKDNSEETPDNEVKARKEDTPDARTQPINR